MSNKGKNFSLGQNYSVDSTFLKLSQRMPQNRTSSDDALRMLLPKPNSQDDIDDFISTLENRISSISHIQSRANLDFSVEIIKRTLNLLLDIKNMNN